MSLKTVNQEPYKDIKYSSLNDDERARFEHPVTLSKVPRFVPKPVNGNLQVAVPEIDNDTVRETLSPFMKVDTNTRTVFNNEVYDVTLGTISEFVTSPVHKSYGPVLQGHKPMSSFSPVDPRAQHCKSPSRPEVGPGFYHEDPIGDKTCGIPEFHEGESHHMTPFAKNPLRESPAFKSPERGAMAMDMVGRKMTQGMAYLPPDHASWTKGSFYSPKEPRIIEAERWGKTPRDKLPKPSDMPAIMYDPKVTKDGHATNTAAYLQDVTSPSYKMAFQSGMPRLVALPGGTKPDTRVTARTHEDLCMSPSTVGPGSYSKELPRFRSFHAAYVNAGSYHTLATESANAPLPDQVRPGSGLYGTRKPTGTGRLKPTLSSPVGVGSLGPSRPSSQRQRPGGGSGADTPGGQSGHGEDPDWEVHRRLAASLHDGVDLWTHPASGPPSGDALPSPSGSSFGGGASGRASPSAVSVSASHSPPKRSASALQLSVTGGSGYYGSAPTTPSGGQIKAAGQFGKLVFLRRATPYQSLIKSAVFVAADLKRARAAVKASSTGQQDKYRH